MFSGIVEAKVALLEWTPENQIVLQKPSHFDDLQIGDSLAINGVCLTLEWQDDQSMRFTLGAETLNVTGWTKIKLQNRLLNVERSLKFGDRVHGHMMAGHVEAMGLIHTVQPAVSSCNIIVSVPDNLTRYLWTKGSLAVNGVSLTINEVWQSAGGAWLVSFCLIPETLRQTNLVDLQTGDKVTLEADAMARVWARQIELIAAERRNELNP